MSVCLVCAIKTTRISTCQRVCVGGAIYCLKSASPAARISPKRREEACCVGMGEGLFFSTLVSFSNLYIYSLKGWVMCFFCVCKCYVSFSLCHFIWVSVYLSVCLSVCQQLFLSISSLLPSWNLQRSILKKKKKKKKKSRNIPLLANISHTYFSSIFSASILLPFPSLTLQLFIFLSYYFFFTIFFIFLSFFFFFFLLNPSSVFHIHWAVNPSGIEMLTKKTLPRVYFMTQNSIPLFYSFFLPFLYFSQGNAWRTL